jgi:hypothetical protein
LIRLLQRGICQDLFNPFEKRGKGRSVGARTRKANF